MLHRFPERPIRRVVDPGNLDDENNTVGFLDWQGVLKAAEESRAKIALGAL